MAEDLKSLVDKIDHVDQKQSEMQDFMSKTGDMSQALSGVHEMVPGKTDDVTQDGRATTAQYQTLVTFMKGIKEEMNEIKEELQKLPGNGRRVPPQVAPPPPVFDILRQAAGPMPYHHGDDSNLIPSGAISSG